ncbi:MAG: hypothetical protein ABI340_05465, partial [Nitrososphaera sp.]
MFFIIQIHLFILVVWWWIKYRWWKYNLKYQENVIPVGIQSDEILFNLFETGDIILCRGEYRVWNHPSYYYALYCSFSRTIFSHVGVILKDEKSCKLYVLHCSPRFRTLGDYFGDQPMPHAFVMHELQDYIHKYKGTSLIRRRVRDPLSIIDDTIEKEKSWLLNQIGQSVCKEYQTESFRFVKVWTIFWRYLGSYDTSTCKEVHCAEFTGVVLKRMGLLNNDIDEWALVPDSFSIEKNPGLFGYEND